LARQFCGICVITGIKNIAEVLKLTLPNFANCLQPFLCSPADQRTLFYLLKYELIPAQLLHEGTFTNAGLFAALPCKAAIVLITYTWEYINKLLQQTLSEKEQSSIGFSQSTQLTLLKSFHGCGMQQRDEIVI